MPFDLQGKVALVTGAARASEDFSRGHWLKQGLRWSVLTRTLKRKL